MSTRFGLGIKAAMATLVVTLLAVAAVGMAAERVAPLSASPTATPLTENAPLGEAMRNAFVGETGVYDPQNGLVQPDETHFNVEIKAAHNGKDIFFQYTVPTPVPSYYHDYVVYQDGKWIRAGNSAVGTEPHGLYEDRISMMVDDGSVKGFANYGGWLTCHEDMRAPFMYAGAENADVQAHPVLGKTLKYEEARKYIPQGRDAGPEWWQAGGWDNMRAENVKTNAEKRSNGVFLDLLHWRSHRSNPIGYSDNEYILDYRNPNPGKGMFTNNWDANLKQPQFMLDPKVAGGYALNWEKVQAQGYAYDDQFYIAKGINAIPFDPNRAWQNGDVIPRRILQEPEGTRGIIKADGKLIQNGENDWTWQVELSRPLDTGDTLADKQFKPGRTYNATVAVHRLAMGSRWHFVSFPFTIGIDTPASVTAQRFAGDRPDWSTIAATTRTVIYPGQTNWEFITSDEHPGANQVRADSMSVIGCHDEVNLAAANKAIETRLMGSSSLLSELDGPRGGMLDPTNAVFLYLFIAVGTVATSVGVGRARSGGKGDRK